MELHREGFAPAACIKGLFYFIEFFSRSICCKVHGCVDVYVFLKVWQILRFEIVIDDGTAN